MLQYPLIMLVHAAAPLPPAGSCLLLSPAALAARHQRHAQQAAAGSSTAAGIELNCYTPRAIHYGHIEGNIELKIVTP